ncbi:STAS/SEC14 domain-containing protein [Archangium sp.]|uniref:STAS/SEC14 domain-containing protein n=1 Tax=Archangium sp. TaxID=1872627 RepID=UPI00286AB00D|nr:STAS/SEC14 domain-containing protein [Archangium sp.]
MYSIEINKQHALVEFSLDGTIRADEMMRFMNELKAATVSLAGTEMKVLVDVRTFRPASPEVAEMIRQVQANGLEDGVKRVAELVDSQVVALQLNRVARESGTDKILRRFSDAREARDWLIDGIERDVHEAA